MTEQPEALRLARLIEAGQGDLRVAAELRRLHAVNQELLEALKEMLFPYREETAPYEEARDQARAAIARAEGQA